MLVNPSPNWNASTIDCLLRPIMSENGAMTGIVMAAFAVALGMKRLISAYTPYMSDRDPVSDDAEAPDARALSIGSSMLPF